MIGKIIISDHYVTTVTIIVTITITSSCWQMFNSFKYHVINSQGCYFKCRSIL